MNRSLQQSQLDRTFQQLRPLCQIQTPPKGWIHTLRAVLGITSTQLAHKLNRSQQSISRLEQAERNQSTTLKSLQQAAQALDCQLVYALIPKKSIHHTLNEKAFQKAQKERNACAHTMRGEQQDVHPHPLKKLIKQHAQKMLEHPKQLWDDNA